MRRKATEAFVKKFLITLGVLIALLMAGAVGFVVLELNLQG